MKLLKSTLHAITVTLQLFREQVFIFSKPIIRVLCPVT